MTLTRLLPSLLLAGAASACALPHGSNARPVNPVAPGKVLLSGGITVPFGVAGATDDGDDSGFAAATTDLGESIVIPTVAIDFPLSEGSTFGVEVATYNDAFASADFQTSAYFVNPRFETRLSERLSLTIDGNIGWFNTGTSDSFNGEISTFPFFAPTIGLRGYVPTGFGGLIISQQIGTGIVTVTLPGSLAYDIPIPLGSATLHLFPEVKWDPTFLLVGNSRAVLSFFSGGFAFMLEI